MLDLLEAAFAAEDVADDQQGPALAYELEALKEFEELGLVEREPGWIAVTPKGRFFVRAISAVFDKYLRADKARVAYSRII